MCIVIKSCTSNIERVYRDKIECNTIDKDNYTNINNIGSDSNSKQIVIKVLNNSYHFNDQTKVIFYVNNIPLYKGLFKKQFVIRTNFKEKESIHCRLEIIEGTCKYIFEDKNVFNWKTSYKAILVDFFPNNPSTENISFSPTGA